MTRHRREQKRSVFALKKTDSSGEGGYQSDNHLNHLDIITDVGESCRAKSRVPCESPGEGSAWPGEQRISNDQEHLSRPDGVASTEFRNS